MGNVKAIFTEVALQTKQCVKCGYVKPIYEFYKYQSTHDGYGSYCKDCAKQISRNQKRHPKHEDVVLCRADLISTLADVGVFASTGKASNWTQVDVVAWGCVKIRVAISKVHENGAFQWKLSRRNDFWDKADLIVLICDWGESKTFHAFHKDHQVFFYDGKRKSTISYTPSAAWNRDDGRFGTSLNSQLMDEHRNRWSLIEQVRLNWNNPGQ